MVTKLDWNAISGAVGTMQRDKSLAKASRAFVGVCLDVLFGLQGSELIACITDGGGDRGVDAIYISSSAFGQRVHLLQCKYRESYDKHYRGFPGSEIDKTATFIADLFSGSILMMSHAAQCWLTSANIFST